MNIIDQYIHEVTKRVPKKMRHDTSIKVKEKIESMLPEDYTNEEVTLVLQKLRTSRSFSQSLFQSTDAPYWSAYYDVYMTFLKIFSYHCLHHVIFCHH